MQIPTTKGEDVMVILDEEENPKPVTIKSKMALSKLKAEYGDNATIYLCNKNLQIFPRRLSGALIWLPSKEIIGAVIESRGKSAFVRILHPKDRKDQEILLEDMTRIEGHFLQLVLGPDTLPIDYTYRARDAGVTLVDRNGCIKMNFHGPDVLMIPKCGSSDMSTSVPPNIKRKLKQSNHDTILNTEPLPKRPKLNEVGVVYVYRHGRDVSKYRFVESHYDARRNKKMPVVSIPIGEQQYSSAKYVCVCLTCASEIMLD
jgi:hypothetical protein